MSTDFTTLASTQTTENTQDDALHTMLANIKNESGEQKYGSVEKALEALQHSQSYIPELKTQLTEREQELANLRIEMAKQQGVQQTLERFSQTAQTQEPTDHQSAESQENTQDIEALVSKQFEAFTMAQKEQANHKQVFDAVVGTYGEKSSEFIANKAKELGMEPAAFDTMAKSSPKAALALLGVESGKARNVSSVTAGSYRNDNMHTKPERVGAPEKSLMRGASSKDISDYMARIKAEVYADLGVQENNF